MMTKQKFKRLMRALRVAAVMAPIAGCGNGTGPDRPLPRTAALADAQHDTAAAATPTLIQRQTTDVAPQDSMPLNHSATGVSNLGPVMQHHFAAYERYRLASVTRPMRSAQQRYLLVEKTGPVAEGDLQLVSSCVRSGDAGEDRNECIKRNE